jgi:hypothetical protein
MRFNSRDLHSSLSFPVFSDIVSLPTEVGKSLSTLTSLSLVITECSQLGDVLGRRLVTRQDQLDQFELVLVVLVLFVLLALTALVPFVLLALTVLVLFVLLALTVLVCFVHVCHDKVNQEYNTTDYKAVKLVVDCAARGRDRNSAQFSVVTLCDAQR